MALKRATAGDVHLRAAVATMVALAELGRRADELCHGVGLLFSVPRGAFAAALKAKRNEDALIDRARPIGVSVVRKPKPKAKRKPKRALRAKRGRK